MVEDINITGNLNFHCNLKHIPVLQMLSFYIGFTLNIIWNN